ncbi:MAG: hypothetical protein WC058_01685 [Phycisphaeraceae bacterium]
MNIDLIAAFAPLGDNVIDNVFRKNRRVQLWCPIRHHNRVLRHLAFGFPVRQFRMSVMYLFSRLEYFSLRSNENGTSVTSSTLATSPVASAAKYASATFCFASADLGSSACNAIAQNKLNATNVTHATRFICFPLKMMSRHQA